MKTQRSKDKNFKSSHSSVGPVDKGRDEMFVPSGELSTACLSGHCVSVSTHAPEIEDKPLCNKGQDSLVTCFVMKARGSECATMCLLFPPVLKTHIGDSMSQILSSLKTTCHCMKLRSVSTMRTGEVNMQFQVLDTVT